MSLDDLIGPPLDPREVERLAAEVDVTMPQIPDVPDLDDYRRTR